MIQLKNETLHHPGKKPIVYDAYYNPTNTLKAVVVFCHGFKGFKDWGAWHLVAEAFANAGFFFLKFNFSHNGGTVDQPIDFPDLEAFAKNNYSKELDDLHRVLNFLSSTDQYAPEIDTNNISLIGHSRGGGIVILKAAENNLVTKVVSWAGVSDFKIRFQEGSESFKAWKKTGRTFVENGRTKQQMPHDWQFYKDFKENEKRLTISRAVKKLNIPQLIVHGSEDPTVSLKEAQQLSEWNTNAAFAVIEGADHVFGAQHPWNEKSLPKHLKKVVDTTVDYLKK